MFNLSSKKHYLTKTMKGFENYYRTIITSVEQYQDENLLHIYLYVNPTNDVYTDVQRIETTVVYNLTKDTYTIKCEGKGARKYNKQVKSDVTTIIDGLVKEANDFYTGDTSEALFMTQQYYHAQLKELTSDTAILNQFYYDTVHTYNNLQEIDTAFNDIVNKLNLNMNKQTTDTTQDTEVYHLYKNTFTTYSDAYNYALSHMIPVTMIVSSLHPTMTNERLQQLEHEYVFSKGNMAYNDMLEYYNYIESLPITVDRDDRYFKLKSYIQRYEYNQEQKRNREEEKQRMSLEGSRLLVFMKEKGLQLDNREGWQRYLYNNEHVYTFHSCSVEKYYNDMVNLFNTYFSQYADEYNKSTIYYYKGSDNTIIDNYNYPKGWISYNNNTKIAAFNRQLTDEEMTQYNLTHEDSIQVSA